ncbi:MAG: hypothetical protein ABR976_13570 [Terracidiphilus sp.]|jgi:hypothetical protein
MLKLKVYRTKDGIMEYWDSWTESGVVFIHSGKVGEPGQTRTFNLKERGAATQILKEVEQIEKSGFTARQFEEDVQVVIHYRLERWGSVDDHTRRVAIEDLMTNCLRRTGLGYCDGGDIGSGTINIFCEVVDAAIAEPIIVNQLREHNHLEGAVIAMRERKGDDTYKVLWPKDFTGAFNLF